jgi:hypothetical protein
MRTFYGNPRMWAARLLLLEYVAFFAFVAWIFPPRPSVEDRH